ncbi:MAG: hypothetical protein AB7D37_01585 [Desulfovibrio sp.]
MAVRMRSRCVWRCRLSGVAALALLLLLTASGFAAETAGTHRVPIPGTGLSLAVPASVRVAKEAPNDPKQPTLAVVVEDIRRLPAEAPVGRADVLAQRKALARGKLMVADEVGEESLARLVALPVGANAAVYPDFSDFEVCDLRLELRAVFFIGEKRVTLVYYAPPRVVIRENPAYFGRDKANCGTATVWKNPGPDLFRRFYANAAKGALGPAGNAWYADFMTMLASLRRD